MSDKTDIVERLMTTPRRNIIETAREAATEIRTLRRHATNLYQDACEGAYAEVSFCDAMRQALSEVAPEHPALKGQPPNFGTWESLARDNAALRSQVADLAAQRDAAVNGLLAVAGFHASGTTPRPVSRAEEGAEGVHSVSHASRHAPSSGRARHTISKGPQLTAQKKPQEMAVPELCDWLAADDGWEPTTKIMHECTYIGWGRGPLFVTSHPFPPTLDSAAAAMPEGWSYTSVWSADNDWRCNAVRASDWKTAHGSGYTEILARLRLAVACRMAMKEGRA